MPYEQDIDAGARDARMMPYLREKIAQFLRFSKDIEAGDILMLMMAAPRSSLADKAISSLHA